MCVCSVRARVLVYLMQAVVGAGTEGMCVSVCVKDCVCERMCVERMCVCAYIVCKRECVCMW